MTDAGEAVTVDATRACDVLVIGSGVSGYCAAIQAGREGCETLLLEKDAVLGGNSGPDLGVGITGADRYNAFATESGLIQELQEEAAWVSGFTKVSAGTTPYNISRRNEAVVQTALEQAGVRVLKRHYARRPVMDGRRIAGVIVEDLAAFRTVRVDVRDVVIEASGDGEMGALAGAAFDFGSESRAEYGERSAPSERRPWVQGTSLVALAQKTDREVVFIPPPDIGAFAPRLWHGQIGSFIRHHDRQLAGDKKLRFLYVTEAGGDMDTIRADGEIYEMLLKQLWAEWDHIKNGPHKEEARNWDLLWVSPRAGKRESRRFLGDVVLTQTDLESGRRFEDDIAYGGHDLDDHQCLGAAGSNIYGHSIPPMYGIPFRSCYSKDVDNLLLAGRLISATHLAHSSTRLMRTGGAIGQAVGLAAAMCCAHKLTPRALYEQRLSELQQKLLGQDGTILCRETDGAGDLARRAAVTPSSEIRFNTQAVGQPVPLVAPAGNLLWDWPERLEHVEMFLRNGSEAEQAMTLRVLRSRREPRWTTSELYGKMGWNDLQDSAFETVAEQVFDLPGGFEGWFPVRFDTAVDLGAKDAASDADRVIVALGENQSVWWSLCGAQWEICEMVEHSHHDTCWKGLRTMGTMRIMPEIPLGEAVQVIDGYHRRFSRGPTHMWLSEPALPQEAVLTWDEPVCFNRVEVTFDNLLTRRHDNPWESGERVHPILAKAYDLAVWQDAQWVCVATSRENYHRFRCHAIEPVTTRKLRLRVLETHGEGEQARVYQVAVFNTE